MINKLIIILISFISFHSFAKTTNTINVYANPKITDKILFTIQNNVIYKTLESSLESAEIKGNYGRWEKIQFNEKTGWIFQVYLEKGNALKLKKTAANYYNQFWAKEFEGQGSNPERKKYINKYTHQTYKNIKITNVMKNYASVQHLSSEMSFGEEDQREDLWSFENNRWTEYPISKQKYQKIKFLHLNDDLLPDIIVHGGCCDCWNQIFLLNVNGKLIHIKQHDGILTDLIYIKLMNCSVNKADIIKMNYMNEIDPKKTIKFFFDCRKNSFVTDDEHKE